MSSHTPSDNVPGPDAVVIVMIGVMAAATLYLIALFIAGSAGIVKQLANPAAHYYFNATILVWTALPLVSLVYLITPEFGCRYRQRIPVAVGSAAVGTIAFIVAAAVLAPSIERPSAPEFLAGGLTLFITFGIMPTFAVGRVVTLLNADVVVARQGDHPIDTDKLTPETARIIKKHCGTAMHRPLGWRPFTLWGDAGRLTHADLQRILALEAAEEKQLTELYRQRTPNEERRTVKEAFKELAAHKANTARQIAALQSEAEHLRQAAVDAGAKDRAALAAAREEKRQALQELARARADLEDARATRACLELTLKDKDVAVRCAAAAVEETKAAALLEISRTKEESRHAQALLIGDIEGLLSAVADLEYERGVARAENLKLREEATKIAAAAASERATLVATQAVQQAEISRLKAKLAEQISAAQERTNQRLAPPKRPITGAVIAAAPRDARSTPRLALVVDNPSQTLFSKSPERQGVPQRLWRRRQQSLRKGVGE